MSKNKQEKSLSWEDFQTMGRSEEVPQFEDKKEETDYSHFIVRIHLEKKHRGGKTASIIRGLEIDDEELKSLAGKIKKHCGTGGSAKDGEIIIQGNQREKIKVYLEKLGIKNLKFAGG